VVFVLPNRTVELLTRDITLPSAGRAPGDGEE